MVNFESFRKLDGFIDWLALRKAEIEVGERCYQCYASIIFPKYRFKVLCYDCACLETNKFEVNHCDYIRCPKCKNIENISGWDCDYSREKYEEGEHEVICDSCEYSYKIYTHIEYSYRSPPVTGE